MPRKRREELREATIADIKAAARKLMGEHGTAGLSIRAIAREIDMTAPALYYYYDNLDDLVTALIFDDYHALAEAMETARDAAAGQPYRDQLLAVMLQFRQWALEHPVDYMLISGNPIPGYEAPSDLTTPAAARVMAVSVGILADGIAAGEFNVPPEAADLPDTVANALRQIAQERGYDTPVSAVYLAVSGWAQVHGLVSLELYHATQPVIGDTEAFYHRRLQAIVDELA